MIPNATLSFPTAKELHEACHTLSTLGANIEMQTEILRTPGTLVTWGHAYWNCHMPYQDMTVDPISAYILTHTPERDLFATLVSLEHLSYDLAEYFKPEDQDKVYSFMDNFCIDCPDPSSMGAEFFYSYISPEKYECELSECA